MKLERNCSLSLKTWSNLTIGIELICSVGIIVLVGYTWLTVDKQIQYIYSGDENSKKSNRLELNGKGTPRPTISAILTDEEARRTGLEGCVITWCLTLLLVLCGWRIISATILILGMYKESVPLLQYWMGYKCVVLLVSCFVTIAAFTSRPVVPSATVSLVLDLVTSYFILVLVPHLRRFGKGQVLKGI